MAACPAGVCFFSHFASKPLFLLFFDGDCMAGWKGSDFLRMGDRNMGWGWDARLVVRLLCVIRMVHT